MSFSRQLAFHTAGITVKEPHRFRDFGGIIADLWSAEGQKGAGGYYLSAHPRIVVFFSDVGHSIRVTNEPSHITDNNRPMARAVYIPAGMPIWSHFAASEKFQHLDLYIDSQMLLGMLTPRLGRSAALAAIKTAVEIAQSDEIDTLAQLVAKEVAKPARHGLFAESLIRAIVSAMLELPAQQPAANAGLTGAQLQRLRRYVNAHMHRRISNAELATEAGLSESWFAHVFKQTTGDTPQQWQSSLRVARAREVLTASQQSLSDVASMLGFSDQAHLTRVFRATTGQTPAVWRRQHTGGPSVQTRQISSV